MCMEDYSRVTRENSKAPKTVGDHSFPPFMDVLIVVQNKISK